MGLKSHRKQNKRSRAQLQRFIANLEGKCLSLVALSYALKQRAPCECRAFWRAASSCSGHPGATFSTFSQEQRLDIPPEKTCCYSEAPSRPPTQCHTAHERIPSPQTLVCSQHSEPRGWIYGLISNHGNDGAFRFTAPPPKHFTACDETNYIFCKDRCRCAKRGTKPQHLRNRWSQSS